MPRWTIRRGSFSINLCLTSQAIGVTISINKQLIVN